ncbi:hypothetical protein F511_39840 [Dorcoceras hygrometricum]|uniref:Uncharacterized protein n=1 Tax=Dorcoceras hygrometricum TaxID=472368 RepID=A0A2Z7B7N6_9LAMI|nr:hypothetical protein F511_39840 [Dorcoceras hygrometricum]
MWTYPTSHPFWALESDESFSKEWHIKTIAMGESNDLNKLELHDLFADMKVYEFELEYKSEGEPSTSQTTKELASTEEKSLKTAEQSNNEAMSFFWQNRTLFSDCAKPKKNDNKLFDRRRGKNGKKSFRKRHDQKVLTAEENKSK